jgi:hypothetical protein
MEFRAGETVEEFAVRLQAVVCQLAVLGEPLLEKDIVKKYLRTVPEKYEQVAISIETMLDLKTLSIEEVTGRLTAAEDRARRKSAPRVDADDKLLLTQEWQARAKPHAGEGASGSSAGGWSHDGSSWGHGARQNAEEERQAAAGQGLVPAVRKNGALGKGVPSLAEGAQAIGASGSDGRRRGDAADGDVLRHRVGNRGRSGWSKGGAEAEHTSARKAPRQSRGGTSTPAPATT